MKHYVVALDESGSPIQNMHLFYSGIEQGQVTKDWSEAVEVCGGQNALLERGPMWLGRPMTKVGGFEVVSEREIDDGM